MTVILRVDRMTPEEAFWGERGVPGGDNHSGRGWTYYSRLGMCKRRFYLAEIEGIEKVRSNARDIGSFCHWAKQLYYLSAMSDDGVKLALDGLSRIRKYAPSFAEQATVADRVFCDWIERYQESDRKNYTVEGVEVLLTTGVDPISGFVYTTRIDTLLQNKKSGRLFVLEHKHWSRLVEDKIMRLQIDGQLLGELYVARQNYDDVEAVIIDMAFIRKDLDFQREAVVATDDELERYMSQIRALWAMRGVYAELGWQEERWSCGTAYPDSPGQPCDFWRICDMRQSTGVLDLDNLPQGLARRGEPR